MSNYRSERHYALDRHAATVERQRIDRLSEHYGRIPVLEPPADFLPYARRVRAQMEHYSVRSVAVELQADGFDIGVALAAIKGLRHA